MLRLELTNKYLKDLKRQIKRGKKKEKLNAVLTSLLNQEQLEAKYKDHALSGNWAKYRECHIEPDWLLIYKIEENTLKLYRTGSHSDLF